MSIDMRVGNGIRRIQERAGPDWRKPAVVSAVMRSETPEAELLKQLFGSVEGGLKALGYDLMARKGEEDSPQNHGFLPLRRIASDKAAAERIQMTEEWRRQLRNALRAS